MTLSSLIEPAQQLAGTDVLVVKGRFEVSGLSTGIFRPDKDGEGGMDLKKKEKKLEGGLPDKIREMNPVNQTGTWFGFLNYFRINPSSFAYYFSIWIMYAFLPFLVLYRGVQHFWQVSRPIKKQGSEM